MNKKILTAGIVACSLSLVSMPMLAKEKTSGRGSGPVVWVKSQNLFYDSIVLGDLPFNGTGNFQKLLPGEGPSGLATEFGPGNVGYVGGRWWVDLNNNEMMDHEDTYFLCPLLGPGREEP